MMEGGNLLLLAVGMPRPPDGKEVSGSIPLLGVKRAPGVILTPGNWYLDGSRPSPGAQVCFPPPSGMIPADSPHADGELEIVAYTANHRILRATIILPIQRF